MRLPIRLLTICFVFFAARFFAANLPSYIEKDKNANVFRKIEDSKLQNQFGGELAMFMRGLRPANAINGDGKLRIRPPKGKRIEVPMTFRTFALGQRLVSEYATKLGTLTVTKQVNAATEYHWAPPPPGKTQQLNGQQAEQSFVGSDFWMADLGLEFLSWPNQKVVNRKLRRGELCSVLISVPAKVGRYSQIMSWVDEDSFGIVHADAYDAKGKLLKEFSPKSFKKIGKQWQLKEMEMRNEQTNTRTSIIFDLKAPPGKDASPQK